MYLWVTQVLQDSRELEAAEAKNTLEEMKIK